MANVLNTQSYGNSGQLQFMDDGSFIFRPKQGASITGVEIAGFLQFDQQSAPAVAPSGSARLYFDTGAQTLQQSISTGAYAALGVQTSLTNGGGSITVTAAGAITETVAAAQALTLNGAGGSSIVILTTGEIDLNAGSGQKINLAGGSASQFIALGTPGQVSISAAANQNITLTVSGTGLSVVTNFAAGTGTGYWVLPCGPGGVTGATSVNASVASNNDTRCIKVFIPSTITVTKISCEVTTLSGGSSIGFALYTTDGNTKVLDSGAMSGGATGIVTATISATVVPAGWYYFAFTSTSTVVILEGVTVEVNTGVTVGIYNAGGVVQMGKGANAGSGGVCPTTLGALSAVNTVGGTQWPFVVIN